MNVPAQQTAAPPATKEPVRVGVGGFLAPENIDQAFRLAQALSMAGDMIPKAFQGKPNEIMAAMLKGMEVGLAPMQSLANIAVINGRATIWGDALPALVQRAGHHVDVDYEGAGDTLTAVATLTRADGRKVVRRFSMADAKRAGLLGKQGPWTQYPQRMLAHRARSWACRDGASDALMGLEVAEEASDYGPDRARDVTPPDTPRRGGVVYREPPSPPVDEIVEHVAEAEISPEELARAEAEALDAIDAQAREAGA